MTTEEAVIHFLEKKRSNELNKSEIKQVLTDKHQFSIEEVNEIVREISSHELEDIQRQKSPIVTLLDSIYFSYFFLLFGLTVITVSIFLPSKDAKTELSRWLPIVMIVGGVFVIFKHGSRIYHRNKSKED